MSLGTTPATSFESGRIKVRYDSQEQARPLRFPEGDLADLLRLVLGQGQHAGSLEEGGDSGLVTSPS